ncbi:MAG: tetratricopeptide repeat protein, partial [Acidobacteriota bacterium]|nr:tetratricopeptide repeat protein [Acidobacteriota bacterium]
MNRKSCFWHHRIYVLFWFLVLSLFIFSCTSDNVAKVEEKSEVILTYPFSDPDPVPILTRSSLWGRGARLYPYYFFDKFSKEGVEKERNYYMALQRYLECLERDSAHTRALCRVAELYCRRGEYRKALSYVEKSLKKAMYDPEANYIYGITARQLG